MKNNFKIMKNMGISWTLFRFKYELKKRAGLLHKKFRPRNLSNTDFLKSIKESNIDNEESLLNNIRIQGPKFFFSQEQLTNIQYYLNEILSNSDKKKAIDRANNIVNNRFVYFSKNEITINNLDWHYSPFIKKKSPNDKHWLDISDLNGDFGDIKFIWELSRFSFVYDLVRGYALTKDDKYVEKYWELVEDWIRENPSEYGVNYKCGQEMSLRVMAWLFGLFSFLNHTETSSERVTTLLKVIYYHIEHVEKHFDFALKSVKNNHTISEAAGMYTVGLLFPFLDKAKKWRKLGKKHLEKEAMWQIYDDGSYIQNSMNYHRLMLQVYTWVLRLGEINGDIFSDHLLNRLKQSIIFLYQHQLINNGKLPNYGMNDGALIHPLSTNEYLDYRPQLNASWMAVTGNRLYQSGKHDESILWLFGQDSLKRNIDYIEKKSSAFPDGGYYTFRNKKSFGMTRCTTFKHRPAQADMLHFDLWINGENILTDAGTYSYNTNKRVTEYFNGTASHNTVMIDNRDQMKKGNRFIWLNWTKSKLLRYEIFNNATIFEGEHYGYIPLTHRRGILNIQDNWIIVDDIFGDFNNSYKEIQLSWLLGIKGIEKSDSNEWNFNLGKDKYKMIIYSTSDSNISFYRGQDNPFKGWQSLYYGDKQLQSQLVVTSKQRTDVRFVTVITKADMLTAFKENRIYLNENKIKLDSIGKSKIFKDKKDVI